MSLVRCPYCGAVLEPKPKRGKKCTHCGEKFLVRKGAPVTQAEAAVRDWLRYLEQFRITRRDFDRHQAELTQQFGQQASVNDTVWRILNSLIVETRNPHTLQGVYREMARLANQEGKDPKPYDVERVRLELTDLKWQGVKTVRIVGSGYRVDDPGACPACQALWGKKYTIEEALAQMPIPTQCENPDGCRCEYVSEGDWKGIKEYW